MVLRALNERLAAEGFDRREYERVVKGVLAKQGMVRRGREAVPLGLDERWVRRHSRQQLARLRELDLRVVGDLGDLEFVAVPGVHTRKVTAEQRLDAAIDGLAFLVQRNMQRGVARRAAAESESGSGPKSKSESKSGEAPS
jgi:hypothetical protein